MFRMCVVMLGAAALAAGGCGGSDDSSSSGGDSTATLTKAQYIAKATAVCKDLLKAEKPFNDQIDTLPKNADGTGDPKKIAPIITSVLKLTTDGVARLRAVGEPSAEKAAIDAYYAKLDKINDVQGKVGDAAATGDREAAKKVGASLDGLLSSADDDAKSIGIPACADAY